jgi:DNA-binding response OmpR family regulator
VIEQAVWGRAMDAGSRTLDTHISRLRIKLALRPENGVRLTSVYSHGYRFEAATADA